MSYNIFDKNLPLAGPCFLKKMTEEKKISRTEIDRLIEEFLEHLEIEKIAPLLPFVIINIT